MVEVPLEIEAELPRDFEGSANLASSGLPRRVRMRAPKDSLKLSTAYRTDRLAVLERRVADVEAALSRVAPSRDLADRIAVLEAGFPTAPISRTPSHPLDEDPDRSPAPPRRATAIEAYAEGLRMELRARAT